MVPYIIGGILVIIVLIVIGLILRKRVYDEVDRHESWKMDIMNRNVSIELQRVKSLNLSGETQEQFESWKSTWDQILTRELPDIEEFLLDAEEAADRFKISTANKNLKQVKQILQNIEDMIEQMFNELDDLLDSEKQSRKEVEEIQPKIKELRHKLIQNRYLYGDAEPKFEMEIQGLQQLLEEYQEAVDLGNYYEAKQLVDQLRENVVTEEERIDEFPVIYKKTKRELPDRIEELLRGIREMKQEGYRIDNLGLESELNNHLRQLSTSVMQLENGDMSEVNDITQSIEDRVADIYNLLEDEAKAKNYIEKHITTVKSNLDDIVNEFQGTNEEVERLQQTYYLEASDLELYANLDKWIHQLEKQLGQIEQDLEGEKQTYVTLQDQLKASRNDLEQLQHSHQEFKEQLQNIRKDEIEARQKVTTLKRDLLHTNKKLQKSNLPGVPSYIWNLLDEATDKSDLVMHKLEEQPLDMGEVSNALQEAETSVNTLIEQSDALIEQAYLVETVIQYANRYRSKYPLLASKLEEAEHKFRDYAYEDALEAAASALEEIEPGALKKLEDFVKVPS
ncbi:septation ring formation regulator EzrA [Paraliobacillus ryukyuensis]|uniref:Septation ring formation regulator EzrA n=1 Tax=Paraliobacillus ryukyuensis TaxID=200904 RepID=A0A366EAN0_9BACI|nr:septation ring formation regulator EzrA [Paraliobacillus ryukyuensis]RBO99372.1 septation ring formation regulator [Paraliobacillus ryukyuensis]